MPTFTRILSLGYTNFPKMSLYSSSLYTTTHFHPFKFLVFRNMSNLTTNIPTIASLNHPIQSEYRCYTRTTRFQCDFTWTIQHIKLYVSKNRNVLKSLTFAAAEDTCKWVLEIHLPYYYNECYNRSTTQIKLKIDDIGTDFDNLGPILGELRCSVIGSNGQNQNSHVIKFSFTSCDSDCCIENFFEDSKVFADSTLIPGDALTIHCVVSYIRQNNAANVLNKHSSNVLNAYLPYPMEDFRTLFNNEELSDVTIYVGDETYPGHKIILAIRSSVFKAMLTHDMKEKLSNRIDIKDIDEKVFFELLRYIYTEKVENIETMAFDLLIAAAKYDLAGLKMMCENQLCRMLEVDTAVKILSYSNIYGLEKLKNRAREYVEINLKKIIGSDSWNDLKSQPELMKAIFKE